MKIKKTTKQKKALFQKEVTVLKISDVNLSDAKDLYQELSWLTSNYRGRDGILELYFENVSGVKNGAIGGNFQSSDDCDNYLFGFALGIMLATGRDLRMECY